MSKIMKNVPLRAVSAAVLFFGMVMLACAAPRAEAQTQNSQRYTKIIQDVFDFIQKNYVDEVQAQKLYEGAMNGMLGALEDPYSTFLAEKDMTELNQNVIQGNYGGVGLYISKPTESLDGKPLYVEIASPIEDTPGWRAGLQPGDLIIKINDDDTDALTLDDVLARLKGPAGETVALIIRRGESLEFPVVLTRAVIEVPTVKHALIGDIGYVKLISFSSHTADRTREALESFRAAGYKNLIVDLRNNYGGLLQSAVNVSSLFIEGGPIVSVKARMANQNVVYNAGRTALVPASIPVVVLINRGSASASEIVAGALKDRGRAYLVGEKSYGKGSVQQVYPLDKSGFKITTARYYTPSDVNIDKIGIPPDREVLFPKFSSEDTEKLNKLILSGKIPAYVKENPASTKEATERFVTELYREYNLDEPLLRRLVRDEQNRTVIAPVYDLDYDVQLQEAVNILRNGTYPQLIRSTKTLKSLQDEALIVDATAS